MDRRKFLKSATATGLAAGLYKATANASIPEHAWDKYDWGPGPAVPDRLYQGPFPQYGPAAIIPESEVWMVTSHPRTSSAITAWAWLSMHPMTLECSMYQVKRWSERSKT